MAPIYEHDVTQLVATALVQLNRLTEGLDATVAVKLEFYNPANSVKDRIGVAIVDAAEKSGAFEPGGTLSKAHPATPGSPWPWWARPAYRVILTMPEVHRAPGHAARTAPRLY